MEESAITCVDTASAGGARLRAEVKQCRETNMTMKTSASVVAAALLALGAIPVVQAQQATMTFFVTSAGPGKGADLGGLEGADRHCQQLAQAAGAGGKTWRAYLS